MPDAIGQSYSNLVFACVGILLGIAVVLYTLRHRKVTGALNFFLLSMFGITWGVFYLLELISRQTALKLFWDSAQFIPVGFIPPLFLIFVARFSKTTLFKRKVGWGLLFTIPVINIFNIAMDGLHHKFRISYIAPEIDNWVMPLRVHYGPLFWILLAYSSLVMLVCLIILIRTYFHTPRWARSNVFGMLAGAALTLVAMAASVPAWISVIPVNFTLITMIISMTIITLSLFSSRMLDILPLARSTLLSQMADGVVTLDSDGLIFDVNPAAESIPLLKLMENIGKSFTDLIKEKLGLALDLQLTREFSEEIVIGRSETARTYDMRVSPLSTDRERNAGMLVVFRDISRRRRNELERIRIQERYQAVFQNPNFGILLVDKNGIILEANERLCQMSGFPCQQITMRPVAEFLENMPDFGGKKNHPVINTDLLQTNGNKLPVEISITTTSINERQYFITVQDTSERKNSEAELRAALENLQSRNHDLSLMRNVTESLNQATSLRAAMLPALETVVAITHSPAAWVYLLGKAEDMYQRIEYHPLDEQNQLVIENMQGEFPRCMMKLMEGKAEAPRKVKNCSCCENPISPDHFTLPLYIGKQPLGVLNIHDTTNIELNENKIRLLHTLSDQLAVAVERVRLFRSEHDQRKLAETMRDIGATLTNSLDFSKVLDLLLEQLSRMIPYDGANVMLIEGKTAKITRLRGYEEIGKQKVADLLDNEYHISTTENIKRIVASGKPEIIADTATFEKWQKNEASPYYHSWVGAPVVIDGKVEALFSLEKVERGFYTQDHAKLLSIFSTQASLAIKNARLFTAEAKRIQELDALRTTLTGISSQLDLNKLLNEIVKRAMKLLNASQGELGLFDAEIRWFENPGRGRVSSRLPRSRRSNWGKV